MTLLEDPAELDDVPIVDDVGATPRRGAMRPRLHRFMTARRGVFVKVHRWLSFVVLIWIVVESLTGSAIVFAGEIDRFVNSEQFDATPGDVGMPAAAKAARTARPNDLVRLIAAPGSDSGHGMYWVYTVGPTGDDHVVLVDPGSGSVTSSDHHPPLVIRWMEEIHFRLNSTSVLGFDPLKVMGWMAVAWLVLLVAGFYAWYWPGVKRWAQVMRVRRQRGAFTFHLDLHKAVGIVAFVPLSLVVITGINFAFPNAVRGTWDAATLGQYEQSDVTVPLSHRSPGRQSITSQQAIEAVRAVDPSVSIQYVTGPGGSPVGVFTIDAKVDATFLGALGGQRTVEFAVDQYTGGIVAIEDPADKGVASRAYDDWAYEMHIGTFAGTTTKWIWVLLGLSPLVLGVTGTRMWLIRRGKRNRRGASRSAATGDAALDATFHTATSTTTVGHADQEHS